VRRTVAAISLLSILVIFLSYSLGSCRKYPDIIHLTTLQQEIPASFPQPLYTFRDNPLTQEGFELGRRLFYDGRLSIDGLHPCSSCHQQIAGFGTYQHDRSHGVNDSHTLRNAQVLFNLAWNNSFHWDGEFSSFTDEAAQPINGHIEMGESFQNVIDKLEKDKTYREQFKKVFRYPLIRPEFIMKALAQFTGSLTSANSKYDQYKKGIAGFTAQEDRGYVLFKANCAGCHPEPLFTDNIFHNIGLPVDPLLSDYGRMRITGKKEDSLKFKTPTLRNSYISANYMHDGRFNILGQCLTHYRTGIQQSPTLDPLLTNGINLTNTEATDIIAFLRTLTDSTFLSDPRFKKPL
jgi:cytochrome c peroxidase